MRTTDVRWDSDGDPGERGHSDGDTGGGDFDRDSNIKGDSNSLKIV